MIRPSQPALLQDELCRHAILPFFQKTFGLRHPGQTLEALPYIQAKCFKLEQFIRGIIPRLIIAEPPRHGKSELVSVALPAWLLGQNPASKVMVVSYAQNLAREHSEASRQLLQSADYQRLFPNTRIAVRDSAELFKTSAGGERRSLSVKGSVTGLGCDFMIIDDLHKADEALTQVGRDAAFTFYQNSLLTRFNDPANVRIVVIQQRLHEDDLIGRLLAQGGWDYLCLPAMAEMDEEIELGGKRIWSRRKGEILDPVRMPLEVLEQKRRELGPRYFNAQYQQNPIAGDGGIINIDWFGQYDEELPRNSFHYVIQSWDPAATERVHSHFSVGMTWGYREGKWYLLDLIRQKLGFVDLKNRMIAWHRQWKADALLIEAASAGHGLYDEARHANLRGVLRCLSVRGSKPDRMVGQTGRLATGDYLLPASAPWLSDLRHELVAFPNGTHDDQVDALSQFLQYFSDNERRILRRYDESGRPIRGERPSRTSRYYDGDVPSAKSW